jgi:hypothetical protein
VQVWDLFIDESGNFDWGGGDQAVVGGVLVRRGVGRTAHEALRAALREAMPYLPWPLHANRLNKVVCLPLLCAGRDDVAPAVRRRAEELIAWMARDLPDETREARAAVAKGAYPAYDDLSALEGWLAGRPAQRAWWLERAEAVFDWLIAFARRAGVPSASGPPPIWCGVVAAEARRRAARMDHRYGGLLVAAVSRAVDLLARQAPARLWVHVGGRDYQPQRALNRDLVVSLLGAAEVAREGVDVAVDDVSWDGPDTDARMVLADFLCNRTWARLHEGADDPLTPLLRDLTSTTGHRLQSGMRGRSHLAADGAPAAAWSARRADPAIARPVPDPDDRPWAWQQVDTWWDEGERA